MHVAALREEIAPAAVAVRCAGAQGAGMVRLLTCGSVDDGKSTLIGRLLWDAAGVTEDQRAAIALASHNRAVNGEKIDFSLLLDGLAGRARAGHHHRHRLALFRDRRPAFRHHRLARPRAIYAQHGDRRLACRRRHPARRRPPRAQAPDAPPCRHLRSRRHQEGDPRRQQDGPRRLRRDAFREIESEFRASGRKLRLHRNRLHSRLRRSPATMSSTARRTCPGMRARPLLDYLEACRSASSDTHGAVPHAGAARAARRGRLPRLCRHDHLRQGQGRRAHRRQAEPAVGHAQAHLDHGRRPQSATVGQAVAVQPDTDLDVSRGAVL